MRFLLPNLIDVMNPQGNVLNILLPIKITLQKYSINYSISFNLSTLLLFLTVRDSVRYMLVILLIFNVLKIYLLRKFSRFYLNYVELSQLFKLDIPQ